MGGAKMSSPVIKNAHILETLGKYTEAQLLLETKTPPQP